MYKSVFNIFILFYFFTGLAFGAESYEADDLLAQQDNSASAQQDNSASAQQDNSASAQQDKDVSVQRDNDNICYIFVNTYSEESTLENICNFNSSYSNSNYQETIQFYEKQIEKEQRRSNWAKAGSIYGVTTLVLGVFTTVLGGSFLYVYFDSEVYNSQINLNYGLGLFTTGVSLISQSIPVLFTSSNKQRYTRQTIDSYKNSVRYLERTFVEE